MTSLFVRRFPKLSQIQLTQRRLLASPSLVDPKNSNRDVVVPPRYFRKNPMNLVDAEDIRDMPVGLRYFVSQEAVELTENTARWIKRPKRHFVQVYSVQLLKSRGDLDQIYGNIVVGRDVAFERELGQDTRHDIDPHGFFRLSGPYCPLWAENYSTVRPKLYRGDHPGNFYHPARQVEYEDDEGRLLIPCDDISTLDLPGKGGIFISAPDSKRYPFDRLSIKDTKITCGTVQVAYSRFRDSADSYLTIKLLEWKGRGDSANIYGRICASNTRLNDERVKSLVFDRKRDEAKTHEYSLN